MTAGLSVGCHPGCEGPVWHDVDVWGSDDDVVGPFRAVVGVLFCEVVVDERCEVAFGFVACFDDVSVVPDGVAVAVDGGDGEVVDVEPEVSGCGCDCDVELFAGDVLAEC